MDQHPRTAVLLVNLGTPDAPTEDAVRTYLREFLSDRRVVAIPPLLWQPILRLFVLRSRPAKSAHAYRQIWTAEGSPLYAITKAQASALQLRFPEDITVAYAMRYGNPSLADRLAQLRAAGFERLLIAPLYPQYCTATTATVEDEVGRVLKALHWQPDLRWLAPYYRHPTYIDALVQTIHGALDTLAFVPERIIVSFHGMPERTRRKGDPYHDHCQVTAHLLSQKMDRALDVTFQSRFGTEKWLKPYTDATLRQLGSQGVKRVAVVAPGFAADCLETLEELAIRGRHQFLAAGGEAFAYLHCLNADPVGIAMLEALVRDSLAS